ncbi:MAG: hypothetical protein IJY11_02185 [Clostridia bacterium]|nr:hypothetical protein [Clostridia bacterium]MBQ9117992.1 hypothetical protein [Clostridia bacterium]
MAIGKNAIKRVENNGYSKVKTTAPDMENSAVVTPVEEEVAATEVKAKAPVKKTAAKKAPAKKCSAKKLGETKGVQLCEEMPYYLL